MSRLHEAKVDEKRWEITETDNENYHTYKLVDKEKGEIYFLKNIIGVEQVTEDEFLVFDRYNRDSFDSFRIVRYKAENSNLTKLFEGKLSCFDFITDDRILFVSWDNSFEYRSSGIYSIKDNNYVEDGKWLDGATIETVNYDDNPDKVVLYVEEEVRSYKLGKHKLLFTVDPNTLQPNSDCFSQLRGSFIKINSKEDIENIKLEDQKDIIIIEDYMYQQEREELQKAKEKILKVNNESK